MNRHELLDSSIEEESFEQKVLARAKMARERFQSFENNAWTISEEEIKSNDLDYINLQNGKKFIYDVNRIEIAVRLLVREDGNENLTGTFQSRGRDWTYVGIDKNRQPIFAKPFFKELPIHLPSNAKWETKMARSERIVNTIEINDLEIELDSVPLGSEITFHSRNPEVAKPTLVRELREFIHIIDSLGYKKIIAYPSDDRRERIYQKMGMIPIPGEDYLIMDVKSTIQRIT